MFDRFLRRGDEARARRMNERIGLSKDGPGPTEEPLSAESVLRALRAMPELDWVRLAAVEYSQQADPDSTKNEQRINRGAHASADRHGVPGHLQREMDNARQKATELARVSAGEEALAAHARFEAVLSGRRLLADPADAPAVERYLGFVDAATNAVIVAALRPHVSRRDFAYLWQGYATVLDFTTTAGVEANATTSLDTSAAVAQESGPVAVQRVTIAEAGGPVAKFLHDVALFAAPASADFAGLARDPAVLAFVDGLARIGAIEWGGVIGTDELLNRNGSYPTGVAFDELVADEGQARAEAMASASNQLASCAVSVVLDVAAAGTLSWEPLDPRMAKTWLEVLDELIAGGDRVVVAGMMAVALDRWLRPETQAGLYAPFAERIRWAHLITVRHG